MRPKTMEIPHCCRHVQVFPNISAVASIDMYHNAYAAGAVRNGKRKCLSATSDAKTVAASITTQLASIRG